MPRPSGKSPRSHHYQGKTYRDLVARLSANVRALRKTAGLTQEEAAHRCGMTTAFFQSIEGEATNPTGITLARLADGLAVDLADLLQPAARLPPRRRGRPAKDRPTIAEPAEPPPEAGSVGEAGATQAVTPMISSEVEPETAAPIAQFGQTSSRRKRRSRPTGD
jgi:transcriptional regulator with XRE-family HTH domain